MECSWIPENESLAWNFLSTVSQESGLNSGKLATRLGADPSQISRAGSKLTAEGYVAKQKVGRKVFWQTTDLGLSILQTF